MLGLVVGLFGSVPEPPELSKLVAWTMREGTLAKYHSWCLARDLGLYLYMG